MVVEKSRSACVLKSNYRSKRDSLLISATKKRTCLSAESVLSGRTITNYSLGSKLPMIPGNKLVLCTTRLCEKLHQPFSDFDRTYPSDCYVTNEYRCLHDNHLKHYFADREWMVKRLRKRGFLSKNGKVLCSLKEYNLYRQYLKHLSVEYFNKLHQEQYTQELEFKRQLQKENIEKKQKDENNPITLRINHARKIREQIEKKRQQMGRKLIRETKRALQLREEQKKADHLRRTVNEEKREKLREKKQHEKLILSQAEIVDKDIVRQWHEEDIRRRQLLEQRKLEESLIKKQTLTERYERKREYHLKRAQELEHLLDLEESNRRHRVETWQNYFTCKWEKQKKTLEKRILNDEKRREEIGKIIEKRLRKRGWTAAPCRVPTWRQETSEDLKEKGKGDAKKQKPKPAYNLSAMGFHNVFLPGIFQKIIQSSEGDDTDTYTSDELEMCSKRVIHHVIDTSCNVLYPMLKRYEDKTGVKVNDMQIGPLLKDLCEGVFDEEEDDLPDLVQFDDRFGFATIASGKQNSSVRFIVSKTDLPLDVHKQHRPPTPKSSGVRFQMEELEMRSPDEDLEQVVSRRVIRKVYESCGLPIPDEFVSLTDMPKQQGDLSPIDSHTLLNSTIEMLANKVILKTYEACGLAQPETAEEEWQLTVLASSIVDDILLYGINQTRSESAESEPKQPPAKQNPSLSTISSTTSSYAALEKKVSYLARKLINDLVGNEDSSSPTQSTTCTGTTSTSALSLIAVKLVTSLLCKVDPATGQTLRDKLMNDEEAEDKVKEMCDQIVNEIIKEQSQLVSIEKNPLGAHGMYQLEEKLSQLALNITSSIIKNQPPSSHSHTSLDSVELEKKITTMTEHVVNGIFGIKKIIGNTPLELPRTTSKNPDEMNALDFVQNIFNLEELQKTPASKFKRLKQEEIENIVHALTNVIVPPRHDSSLMSSGISELAEQVTDVAMKTVTVKTQPKEPSKLQILNSSVESAISVLAHTLTQESILNGNNFGTSTESAISAGASELADHIADKLALKIQSSKSSTAHASDELVDMIVTNVLESLKQQALYSDDELDNEKIDRDIEKVVSTIIENHNKEVNHGEIKDQTPSFPRQAVSRQKTDCSQRKRRPLSKMYSTGSVYAKPDRSRFKTSFNDFRTSHGIDLSPLSTLKRHGSSLLDATSSEVLCNMLDTMASRIVSTAIGCKRNDEKDSKSSVEKLLPSLAFGMVSSLLGIESDTSDIADDEKSSTDNDISATKVPDPSGLTNPTGIKRGKSIEKIKRPPSAKQPFIDRQNIQKNTEITSESILQILRSNSDCNTSKKEWRCDRTCADNAQDHPNRIPSPSNNKIKRRNMIRRNAKKKIDQPKSPTRRGFRDIYSNSTQNTEHLISCWTHPTKPTTSSPYRPRK